MPNDFMVGGPGRDLFRFELIDESFGFGGDTISDFERGKDKIDLSNIDANSEKAGNQAFKFIGSNDSFGTPGVIAYEVGAGGRILGISVDVDGDQYSDGFIYIQGNYDRLSASDFIL